MMVSFPNRLIFDDTTLFVHLIMSVLQPVKPAVANEAEFVSSAGMAPASRLNRPTLPLALVSPLSPPRAKTDLIIYSICIFHSLLRLLRERSHRRRRRAIRKTRYGTGRHGAKYCTALTGFRLALRLSRKEREATRASE